MEIWFVLAVFVCEYGSGKTELDINIIVRYRDPKWTYTCFLSVYQFEQK